MKKSILVILALLPAFFASAQTVCTPDPFAVIAGLPGLWPNPQMGPLPDGNVGQAYSETITVIVPQDTTIDTGQFGLPLGMITVSINSLTISNVSGLPAGLSYACDQVTCSWAGGSNGCLKISGTPTTAGVYSVACSTSINVNVPNFGPFSTPSAPASYDLTIVGTTGLAENVNLGYQLSAPNPNPASSSTRVDFVMASAGAVSLEMRDIQGRLIRTETLQRPAGLNFHDFDLSNIPSGLYILSMQVESIRLSTKLVVE